MTLHKFRYSGLQITGTLPSIMIAVFLFMMAVGLLNIFLSVRMSLTNVSAQLMGVVMACYFAGMMAGSLHARKIVSRVGHIRSFTTFAAVATISVLLHGLLDSLLTWSVLRALTGFSLAGMYLVIESWLQEIATQGDRGRLFSLYMISNYLGMAAGQLMLNVGDPIGIKLVLVTALLFAMCLIPIALTRAAHPAQIEIQEIQFFDFMRRAPQGALGSFSSGMIIGAYLTLAPAWGVQYGLNSAQISVFMALSILGGLILQWPIGKLSDRYNRGLMMVGLGVAMILMPFGFIFDIGGQALTLLGALAFGGIAYSVYPLSVCHANDQTPQGQFVMTTTVMLLLYGIGAAAGPLLAALFMWLLGASGLFVFIIATAVVFSALMWRWRDREPDQHQTAFVAVPRTTPLVPELDPRAEEDAIVANGDDHRNDRSRDPEDALEDIKI